MKRIISSTIVVSLILSMLLLASCGKSNADLSDSKYIGTWKATTVGVKEETGSLDEEWTLTLNGDGTGEFVSAEGPSKITWELTNNGFKTKGDTKLTFTDDGDNIKAKLFGVDLIFERQQ